MGMTAELTNVQKRFIFTTSTERESHKMPLLKKHIGAKFCERKKCEGRIYTDATGITTVCILFSITALYF